MANSKGTWKLAWNSLRDSQSSRRGHGSGVLLLEGQRARAGGVLR